MTKTLDLTKRIDLYYGKSPIEGAKPEMVECLSRETEFCALFHQNDLPAEVHNQTSDLMLRKYGAHSDFPDKNKGSYIKGLITNKQNLAEIPDKIEEINASALRNSRFKSAGFFFGLNIAPTMIQALQELGYQIERKYN